VSSTGDDTTSNTDSAQLPVGDIYPETPRHAVPEPVPLDEFFSWHLPRKQWVRRKQWADTTAALIDSIGPLDRPVRYLGLPGTEMLDLEVLAETCMEKNIRLKYIGFNSGAQTPERRTIQHLAEQALRDLDAIEQPSLVLPDDIVALGSATSVATRRMREFESFDVVNLDFCDVFSGAKGNQTHTAVRNIVEFQLHRRSQSWLMYLTTAIAADALDGADLAEYRNLFESNSKRSAEFGNLLSAPDMAAIPIGSGDPFSGVMGARLGRLLTVGVGKWLLALVAPARGWSVELKSCVCYRRGLLKIDTKNGPVQEPDLFSLVFGFRRVEAPVIDPTGLARNPAAATKDWDSVETKAAIQIVSKAAKALDLDVVMQNSEELSRKMLDESARMLRLRNYDETKYRQWAAQTPKLVA